MAGFMTKDEILAEAERLGINIEGLSWQQQQKVVAEARKADGHTKSPREEKQEADKEAEIAELKRQLAAAKEQAKHIPIPQTPVVFELGKNQVEPTIEDYDRAILIASPEQRPTSFQRNKWYESVGTEKITEDIYFGVGKQTPFENDEGGTKNATYKITETGRPVTAESTMPKYSCLLTYRPTKDLCAIAKYGGRRGYLWTHQRLPNVRGLLRMMGVYEEYKQLWLQHGTGRIFYLGGLLCVDIQFTNEAFERIKRELRERDEKQQ